MTTGTWRRRTNSSANWLAMRPAPITPTLVIGLGERLVRGAGRPLGALLHEVERVDARLELVAGDELGERVVLGVRTRSALVGVLGRLEQLERGVWRTRDGADRLSSVLRAMPTATSHFTSRSILPGSFGRLTLVLPAMHAVRPGDRVLEEARRVEDRVGDAELEGVLALERAVVLERVLDDHLERVLDADQVRQQPRTRPSRGSGQGRPRAARSRARMRPPCGSRR